jgi:hypothetical protein
VPLIAPVNESAVAPFVIVRDCEPKTTDPVPDSEMMETGLVAAAMLKMPVAATLLEAAMLPFPVNARVPTEMVVTPV